MQLPLMKTYYTGVIANELWILEVCIYRICH